MIGAKVGSLRYGEPTFHVWRLFVVSSNQTLDVYDSEVKQIGEILAELQGRTHKMTFESWERMAHERFAEIGFKITIDWYSSNVDKVYIPEISIVDRIDHNFEFDRNQQVSEVTRNVLDIPGEEGVIKTGKAEMDKMMGQASKEH